MGNNLGMPSAIKVMDFTFRRYLNSKTYKIYPELGFLLSNMGDLGNVHWCYYETDNQIGGVIKDTEESSGYVAAKPSLFSSEELKQIPPIGSIHCAVTANVSSRYVRISQLTLLLLVT